MEHVRPCSSESKFFHSQIIAGVVDVLKYENRSIVQSRRISNVYTPNNTQADLAIAKVNLQFVLIYTVQNVTLAPSGFIPLGNKHFIINK